MQREIRFRLKFEIIKFSTFCLDKVKKKKKKTKNFEEILI